MFINKRLCYKVMIFLNSCYIKNGFDMFCYIVYVDEKLYWWYIDFSCSYLKFIK